MHSSQLSPFNPPEQITLLDLQVEWVDNLLHTIAFYRDRETLLKAQTDRLWDLYDAIAAEQKTLHVWQKYSAGSLSPIEPRIQEIKTMIERNLQDAFLYAIDVPESRRNSSVLPFETYIRAMLAKLPNQENFDIMSRNSARSKWVEKVMNLLNECLWDHKQTLLKREHREYLEHAFLNLGKVIRPNPLAPPNKWFSQEQLETILAVIKGLADQLQLSYAFRKAGPEQELQTLILNFPI